MVHRFVAAVQFLTLIPTPRQRPIGLSQAAPFFPIVGALLGSFAGWLLWCLQPGLGTPLAALITLATLLFLTGSLHEDGLADVADAVRAGRSRETILRILKDSRIGTYGAVALVVSLLLRWQALTRCCLHPVLELMAALALSRAALVALAGSTPSVGEGLGAHFIRDLSPRLTALSIALGLCIAIPAAGLMGLIMALATALVVLGARFYFLRRIGGVTGDCLGATCHVVETLNLLILAWQRST